jgi:CorA-like Mg2+ transporter protein
MIYDQPIHSKEPFYSYHVFLFPFEWEHKEKKNLLLEEQTTLKAFVKHLEQPDSKWKRDGSWYDGQPQTLIHYNEVSYFHDFVRKALYDDGTPESFLKHFRYQKPPGSLYCLEANGITYKLEIDDILLHVYNTGVGVLSFHLYNRERTQSSPDDILRINQYGRRLYPPFYGTNEELLGEQEFFRDANWLEGLNKVKGVEMPVRIWLEANGVPFIVEDFSVLSPPPKLGKLPATIMGLLPVSLIDIMDIAPALDDRMFVLCWYGNDDLIKEVQQRVSTEIRQDNPNYKYECHEWWYKFIFVDGGMKTCDNDIMTVEFLRKHTNARWVNSGTLFGASRYSFVCLTNEIPSGAFARIIVSHVQTMYYKIAELCLVQRACILRFSDEVTEVSKLKPEEGLAQRVSSLYRQYIRFVNKIYFREVTAQEQGIELYDLLQQHMRLEQNVKDLDGEIQELHQYARLMEEEKRNKALERLTYLGALFLVPTFVVGYYGMNVFPKLPDGAPPQYWVLLSSIVLVLLVWAALKAKGFWRWVLVVLFFAGMGGVLLGLSKLYFL